MTNLRLIGILSIGLALFACASSKPKNGFELTISDGSASIDFSREMIVTMLENSLNTTFECDGDVDADLLVLLEPLERKRYGTTSVGQGDERIIAKRRGSRLTLTVGDPSVGHLEATVPWAVGECLLGHKTSLDDALGSKAIKFVLTTNDGTRISATVS